MDWILQNDLTCINDGSPTRMNRGTGGMSTPDTTFVTAGLSTKTKWSVVEETNMDSDHLPIVIEVKKGDIQTIDTTPFRTRWKSRNVDWKAFREAIEKRINLDRPWKRQTLGCRVERFNEILTRAGNKHVGKTKPSRRRFTMNPKVKALVRKRNQLRKEISTKRKEWLDAAAEVRVARAEAKETAWTEFVESLEVDDDVNKVWRTIKSLDKSQSGSAPNEALSHNGKTVTTNRAKADIFASHYAKVSSLKFNKQDRDEIRNTKKKIYSNGPEVECPPFTTRELNLAIKKMKRKGAPGNDDIPPSFLKELGPKARQELLAICNSSLQDADVPQLWRHGIIIPLLKQGKPASELASYRPICLTSCVVKTIERMICNRLYTMAEVNGWLCNEQAGFRKYRSTEDQIVKLIQRISDGFQARPQALRTVMVLLDYSKAYDKTWKERLLSKIHDLGTPRPITRWIAAFLRTRTAQVLVNGTKSKNARMKQGLPQGSVLSPLLFLLFINDISKVIPDDVESPLFADDASLYSQHADLLVAQGRLQVAVSAVEQWSTDNKLELNVDKSCTYFFTTSSKEHSWRPKIKLLGKDMKFGEGKNESDPKFLGVTLDKGLAFTNHVNDVCSRVTNRRKILFCLSSKQWGWKKRNLKRIYVTMIRSVMDYAAIGWQPWLSKTQFKKLEVAQNACLRAITGQYANSDLECIRAEAGVPSYRTHSDRMIAIGYEKGMRLPLNYPRREAIENEVRHRLKKSSFKQHAEKIIEELSIANAPREPISIHFGESAEIPHVNWEVTDNLDIKQSIEELGKRIDGTNADITIYTDGSCKSGTTDGGAAAVITRGTFSNPVCVEVIVEKGRVYTCSYEEEKRAMLLGINWLSGKMYKMVTFATDSLSLLQAIDNLSQDTTEIRQLLPNVCEHANLMYVPGHRDIPGNEMADEHAKRAATLTDPPDFTVPLRAAKTIIKSEIRDPPVAHHLGRLFYDKVSQDRDHKEVKTRRHATMLAQIRSGHYIGLSYYDAMVDKTETVQPTCQRCESGEIDNTEHWLTKCDATVAARRDIFGTVEIDMVDLAYHPSRIIRLAERTLVRPATVRRAQQA